MSAATSVALQHVDDAPDGLRLGDLVAVRDWQAEYYTGYSKGDVVVGVVACGDSPILGNGPALTLLLSGPTDALAPHVDRSANLVGVLNLSL